MKILVTGGAGFIGSNFVHYQCRWHANDEIVVIDALTYAGRRENLAGVDVLFLQGNICDEAFLGAVFRHHRFDAVVHFAAESHVDRCTAGPLRAADTNVLGTMRLLDQARRADVPRFLHISTDEVYGDIGFEAPPSTERSPLAPRTPYAASKAAADCFALAWWETYGYPVLITRSSNNYGPRQHEEKFLPLAIRAALAGESIPLHGDGRHVRDWLHVDDHCAALDLVLRRGRPGQIYNVGHGVVGEVSITDVARCILRTCGRSESALRYIPDRPGNDRRYAVDPTKICAELGWRPRINFVDGLAELVDWHRARRCA